MEVFSMFVVVPRTLEREEAPTALAEVLAVLGVTAWALGLVWIAVHLLTRAHSHHAEHRHARPRNLRRP
ncbi:MAG TPA: hypothetical protein VFZ64_11460 [Nocardioidaceae bacterium]